MIKKNLKNQDSNYGRLKVVVKVLSGLVIACLVGIIFLVIRDLSRSEIVYVDTVRLLAEYQGVSQSQFELNKKITPYKLRLDTLELELSQLQERLVSPAGSKEIQREMLIEKQAQIALQQKTLQDKIVEENNVVSGRLLETVNSFVREYGARHGHRIILATSQSGNIVFGDKSADITDDIIKGLNENLRTP